MITNYYIMFFIIFGVGIYLLQNFIAFILNEYINYLHSIGRATPILLRSEIAKSQRYDLIQKLINIKRKVPYFLILMSLLFLSFLIMLSISNNSIITKNKIIIFNQTQENLKLQKDSFELVLDDKNYQYYILDTQTQKDFQIQKTDFNLIIVNKNNIIDSLKIESKYKSRYNTKLERINNDLHNTINELLSYD